MGRRCSQRWGFVFLFHWLAVRPLFCDVAHVALILFVLPWFCAICYSGTEVSVNIHNMRQSARGDRRSSSQRCRGTRGRDGYRSFLRTALIKHITSKTLLSLNIGLKAHKSLYSHWYNFLAILWIYDIAPRTCGLTGKIQREQGVL